MKKYIRNKNDPYIEEVELLQSNPYYSFVKHKNGRESTVLNRNLAPLSTPIEHYIDQNLEEQLNNSTTKRQQEQEDIVDVFYDSEDRHINAEHIDVQDIQSATPNIIIGHEILKDHSKLEFKFGGNREPLKICNVMNASVPPVSLFTNLSSDIKPVAVKSRRYSKEDSDFINTEISKLLADGVIEPSVSPWRAKLRYSTYLYFIIVFLLGTYAVTFINHSNEYLYIRMWIFREVNVPKEKLEKYQSSIIGDLVYPRRTILDESLGSALWFAARWDDELDVSPCRILLIGSGADELYGGYMRHRQSLRRRGWLGLSQELLKDWKRISFRNLARDNRVICDHGRQPRMPYLDEDHVNYVLKLKPWLKCFPSENLECGVGDKLMLRLVALHLGLKNSATLPKRALQFGSRIANKKEKGSDLSKTFI
nr:uncharacterized protein LOC113394117 [Vanessa tameamea]